MSNQIKRRILARDIARALRYNLRRNAVTTNTIHLQATRNFLVAGLAIGILQPVSVSALTLDQLQVQSTVGQPLKAITTAHTSAGETLKPGCVSTVNPTNGMNGAENIRVSAPSTSVPGSYPLQLSTIQPLQEPMYEIRLKVDCPGTSALVKSYVVMLALPTAAPAIPPLLNKQNSAQAAPEPQTGNSALSTPATTDLRAVDQLIRRTTPTETARLESDSALIDAGMTYRVRQGDTLSTIAERVADRPAGSIWQVSDIIFQSNPNAFVKSDPNLIKLGYVITIPALNAMAATPDATPEITAPIAVTEPVAAATEVMPAEPLLISEPASTEADTAVASPEPASATIDAQSAREAPAAATDVATLTEPQPAPQATPTSETLLAEESQQATQTGIEQPTTIAEQANIQAASAPANKGINPLLALALGALTGLIIIAIMFGRRLLDTLRPGRKLHRQAMDTGEVSQKPSPVLEQNVFPDAAGNPALQNIQTSDEPRGGINVSESEAPADMAELDFDIAALADSDAPSETGNHQDADTDLPLDLGIDEDINAETASPSDTPRIGLHEHSFANDAENTEFMVKPDLQHYTDTTSDLSESTPPNSDYDGSGTMRDLFNDLDSIADDAPTQELPDLTSADQAIANPNLQTLTASANDGEMSDTLTQALGLLEQDYEDELTASQLLDAQEVRAALAGGEKG